MTKLPNSNRKNKLTFKNILVNSVLQSITKDALYNDDTKVHEVEVQLNKEVIGYVTYSVSKNVLDVGRPWSYDHPPSADEVEITLEMAIMNMMYSGNGKKLPNLTKYLNGELLKSEGKILEN